MSDLVLVHGTTQTAAGFGALVGHLEDAGHGAICVTVPNEAATSAAGQANLLAAQVPAEVHAPVVVAHSAAGRSRCPPTSVAGYTWTNKARSWR